MSYASLAELKNWLGISDTSDDTILQTALDGATEWIDNYTGRVFVLDSTDQTKLYYADEQGNVDVTDLVTLTSVKVDTTGDRSYATTLATTDYELLPYNEGRYDRIRIWPTSSKSFTQGRLVQVIGKFGYVESGAAPAAVKLACMILASRYKGRKDAPFGILGATDLGQFERISKEDPDVVSLLNPYMTAAGARGGSWVVV